MQALMGLGVAMPAICYRQLGAEEHATLSWGWSTAIRCVGSSRWDVFADPWIQTIDH